MNIRKLSRRKIEQHQTNRMRPFLGETLPESFSLYTLVAMGMVSILASAIVMNVLLRIVWSSNPLFIL